MFSLIVILVLLVSLFLMNDFKKDDKVCESNEEDFS